MSKLRDYAPERFSGYSVTETPLIMQVIVTVGSRLGLRSGADTLTFDAIRQVDPEGARYQPGFNWNAVLESWSGEQIKQFWNTVDELALKDDTE